MRLISQEVEIINKLGLHARASSKFTQMASSFKSDVEVSKKSKAVNGKSIMGLMMLAATKGTKIQISCNGVDEEEALSALIDLVDNRFDEGE